ncbi:MAG: carboxypeptidase-like regulatory domain-containing protein, partial [Bacteroidota bacterium]|nr:carboxypeptidase-like regulatory domain-containing protein [Bacteroidota bacterium]
MKICLLFISMLMLNFAYAQKGIIRGKIVDKVSGESLIGAIVEVQKDGQQVTGASTDIDGNYLFELDPNTYTLTINYLSYAPYTISEVEVKTREVKVLDIALEATSEELVEVVVKADAIRTTEVALIALQRKAYTIQDGLSSQQITRTGSSNAADAIRQMPGAVIEGDRFIVVRGLGDRYSISQLNGATLPGTDPYRNSTSMDLIPSQMIDNIISVKTFTPDLPGNFSGGLINISTKSIPDQFNLSFGINTSYNTQSSLIDHFQSSPDKGKYDWLGFEDGSRNQPDMLLQEGIRNQLSSSTYLDARQPGNDE